MGKTQRECREEQWAFESEEGEVTERAGYSQIIQFTLVLLFAFSVHMTISERSSVVPIYMQSLVCVIKTVAV